MVTFALLCLWCGFLQDGHICPDVVQSYAIRQAIYHEEVIKEKFEANMLKRARNPILGLDAYEITPSSTRIPSHRDSGRKGNVEGEGGMISSRSQYGSEVPPSARSLMSGRGPEAPPLSSSRQVSGRQLEGETEESSNATSQGASMEHWREFKTSSIKSLQQTHPDIMARYRNERAKEFMSSKKKGVGGKRSKQLERVSRNLGLENESKDGDRDGEESERSRILRLRERVKRERLKRIQHEMDRLGSQVCVFFCVLFLCVCQERKIKDVVHTWRGVHCVR